MPAVLSVPLMTPVAGAIEAPVGRPVALKVSVSPSASVASESRLAVAPKLSVRSTRFVVIAGALLTTVTAAEVTGALLTVPSLTVTRTSIWSPRSPLPAVARFSVEPVAPTMSRPARRHW